jgi:acetyl-CoA carboxylase biotin carboxyl carrier protein
MSNKAIANVAKMMDDIGLTEITTETMLFFGLIRRKIHLSKQDFCITNAATGAGIKSSNSQKSPENQGSAGGNPAATGAISSPMVGVVYLSPDPSAKPFISAGAPVKKGDTLCLVEAMKTFNPIKAPADGTVVEILVKDGETVEFGTPLVVVK